MIYDHFDSKRELYRRLLERHFAELREIWRTHLAAAGSLVDRLAGAVDAWFAYIHEHPFAGRMLFRDTTGERELEAMHAEVAAESRAEVMLHFATTPEVAQALGDAFVEEGLEMAWEAMRGILQGLAMWWYEHPDVERERVVFTAMNAIWVGFDRVQHGEVWRPGVTTQ